MPMGDVDETKEIGLLIEHAADHDEIGPIEIGVGQIFGVAVYEPYVPFLGEHRCDSNQAERGGRIPGADELAGLAIIPKRIWNEKRVNHQDAARTYHSAAPSALNRQHRTPAP